MKYLALAGGVGGAKLALGLTRILPPSDLTIVVNTADDEEFHGLHVSPVASYNENEIGRRGRRRLDHEHAAGQGHGNMETGHVKRGKYGQGYQNELHRGDDEDISRRRPASSLAAMRRRS